MRRIEPVKEAICTSLLELSRAARHRTLCMLPIHRVTDSQNLLTVCNTHIFFFFKFTDVGNIGWISGWMTSWLMAK